MKDYKISILLVLLIISIVFHGIITKPKVQEESRFEVFAIDENRIGVYDKENGKIYYKDVPNVNYTDWTLFVDLNEFK